jgi:enoyl-CoA hydratase/carnithine racemase
LWSVGQLGTAEQSGATNVSFHQSDGIARVHLDRPDRLNAVVPALVEDLLSALDRARSEGASVVVLAGRGRSFCAGHDLKEPQPEEDAATAYARLQRIQDVTRAIRALPGVVIAAVHGYALGAGCEFALGCDLVVASEDARFGFPEVGVGLSVTGGISRLLPAAVGLARAKELVLLGEHVTAEQAAALGLVNRVVAVGQHEAAADALARRCRDAPQGSLRLAKAALDDGLDATVGQALDREVDDALVTMATGESAGGRARFDARGRGGSSGHDRR